MQRIVVISGAGSGIGAATAVRFAAQGDTVILLGRRPDALNDVTQQCDGQAVTIPCDVSNTEDVARAVAQVQAHSATSMYWSVRPVPICPIVPCHNLRRHRGR